jgi:glycosyltransferase involved in cell wall biosynthesis
MKKPIRILQVVYMIGRGGVGTWLMHVLRHIDRENFKCDFLVHTPSPSPHDDEARSLGAKIIYCPYPSLPWTYAKNFKNLLNANGPYDVIHSHLVNSAVHLRLAKQCNIPVRIAHIHSIYLNRMIGASLKSKAASLLYWSLSRFWLRRFATLGFAVSKTTALSTFGQNWQKDPRWQIFPCSIDMSPFHVEVDQKAIRKELDIPETAMVFGHVGRFTKEKNHSLLIDIGWEISKIQPDMLLLLVGNGPLKREIEQKAAHLGIRDKVIFTDIRHDVPRLMQGAMDIFLFPSIYEGLGLVLIEAQTAGLQCITSQSVPEEATVIHPLVNRLSLSKPASTWAHEALKNCQNKPDLTKSEILNIMENSPFNIKISVQKLQEIYSSK